MNLKNQNGTINKLPPGQTPIKKLLRWGIDHPGIATSNPQIDLKTYILTIDGEVQKPLKLTWNEVLHLPKVESVSDFHCVEGWSVLNCKWEGIRFDEISTLAKPNADAKFVTFECADGYSTSLSVSDLSNKGAPLAHGLNGQPLEIGYGFPLRLIVPAKYGYKSAL